MLSLEFGTKLKFNESILKMRFTEKDFEKFEVSSEKLAPWLIGKILYRKLNNGNILHFRILETEAYGDKDSATHANKYKTGNATITQRMEGGTIYVHYKSGNYSGSSFDIVAGKKGEAESVLIRGAVNINTGEKYRKIRLLGEALYVDYEKLNQVSILKSDKMWLEDDGFVTEGKIMKKTRIGLDTAKDICNPDKKRLLRFVLNEKEF